MGRLRPGLFLTGYAAFLAGNLLSDLLRYGAWFCFLLVLLLPESSSSPKPSSRWSSLASIGVALVAIGVIAQAMAVWNIGFQVPSQRIVLLDALGVTVFALVLLEQLWRSVSLNCGGASSRCAWVWAGRYSSISISFPTLCFSAR